MEAEATGVRPLYSQNFKRKYTAREQVFWRARSTGREFHSTLCLGQQRASSNEKYVTVICVVRQQPMHETELSEAA